MWIKKICWNTCKSHGQTTYCWMYCFVIHIKHGYCVNTDDDESDRYCDMFQVEYMKSLWVKESSLLLLSQYRELDAPHFLFIYHTLWFQKKNTHCGPANKHSCTSCVKNPMCRCEVKTNITSFDNIRVLAFILSAPARSRGHAQIFESESKCWI